MRLLQLLAENPVLKRMWLHCFPDPFIDCCCCSSFSVLLWLRKKTCIKEEMQITCLCAGESLGVMLCGYLSCHVWQEKNIPPTPLCHLHLSFQPTQQVLSQKCVRENGNIQALASGCMLRVAPVFWGLKIALKSQLIAAIKVLSEP